MLDLYKNMCYNFDRQKAMDIPYNQQEPHEVLTRGVLYSVWTRWLMQLILK